MTTEKKVELVHEPGRIDTLTADQEQKLKDMWAQVLMYTGALAKDLKNVPSSLSAHSAEKHKKKKRGFFGLGREQAPEQPPAELEANALKNALDGVTGEELNQSLFSMIKADNPDNLLLRFLRARKYDVKAALEMLGATLAWRLKDNIEDILHTGEMHAVETNDDEFLLQLRSKKSYIWGHDYRGRPIVHVKPHNHDPKSQGPEAVEKYTVFLIETARLCLKDPVDTAAVLFDLSHFSLSNMDNAAVKFIIKCFEGHFPESLGVLMIHKAPWVFASIWNIIKGWLDPVVVSKIHFTKNTADLAKFIPMEFIEKDLGGDSTYEFEYIEPVEGENDLMKDKETIEKLTKERDVISAEFIDMTIQWIKSESKETNKETQDAKNEFARQLRENYWKMDAHVRARSVFDRSGSLEAFKKLHDENWS